MSVIGRIMKCLFPGYCFACGKIGTYMCVACRTRLIVIPKHTVTGIVGIDRLVSVFWYKGVFQNVLKGIKYYGVGSALDNIFEAIPNGLIATLLPVQICSKHVLIPVPQHSRRRNERSFNQADRIARFVQGETGCIIRTDIIERSVYTPPLAHIPKTDRARIINGAFRVTAKDLPESTIIVDDVWTTGSTIKEIARVLRAAGVKDVWVFTLARSFEPQHAIIR